jgi:hypothetical protein
MQISFISPCALEYIYEIAIIVHLLSFVAESVLQMAIPRPWNSNKTCYLIQKNVHKLIWRHYAIHI